jgi:predicted phosphodiesterase
VRVAVLADIHGNLAAFEAALEDVEREEVDNLYLAGDVVIGSPDSAACWKLARSLGCRLLRGNHERYIAHYGTVDAAPIWSTEQFSPVRWAHAQFDDEARRSMDELPRTFEVAPDLLLVHASARSDIDNIYPHTPEVDLTEMFRGTDARFILRAHNHISQTRLWGERRIVTCGSVGLPLDGHTMAQYLIAERRNGGWSFEHRSVPYDVDATLRRFRETGYVGETGPMGRLFMREVATATSHLVPFLHLYARWSEEPVPLSVAVDCFLNGF